MSIGIRLAVLFFCVALSLRGQTILEGPRAVAGPESVSTIRPAPTQRQLGFAKVDITPAYPIRLSGYGNRKTESAGTKQPLYAKAMAVGSDAEGPAVIVTVDNCGVPDSMRAEVIRRLATKTKITDSRFTIASSHTHSAPMLTGVLPNLFSTDIPPGQQATIARYTAQLTDWIEQAALAALADRKPGQLQWAQGKVEFGKNRRTPNGPSDNALPVLRATDATGKVRGLIVNYACHCTTVTGEFNQFCGDWAGYAQEYLERDHPGIVALTSIGCGADQNPFPRPGFELAQQHGQTIATEVQRLFTGNWTAVNGPLVCDTKRIELPFDTLPTRAEWEAKAKEPSAAIAYHAKKNLARLDRGETLPTKLPYLVQSWGFGRDLALVFLPGEVVVDYSLRLKRELDGTRLWVSGYANDVPCYIPSERILREGGYEGGGAMVYYDRPTKFAMEVESLIIAAVKEIVPPEFHPPAKKAASTETFPTITMAAAEARNAISQMVTKPGFTVSLAASEPAIVDPVAFDFGRDGRLWVVEMHDYPLGLDGNYSAGGRVKTLLDKDGDGYFETAATFLDKIPFPTGVFAWGRGALVCAAPDIIYAEDIDGDGKADKQEKWFTGFVTTNYQARVNALALGLDNWIHAANGLLGGDITNVMTGEVVNIRGRDFRFHPMTRKLEVTGGLTQQGRVRDDWGNWFGCDNSHLLWHYPLPERYARRNPLFTLTEWRVDPLTGPEAGRVYPVSELQERFNRPEHANRVTSGCGLGLYRDIALGADYYGDAFVCEPVHNLVTRMKLTLRGATFIAGRVADEQRSEFLASRDPWFRPVQVATGPDGALWVADMYREVVEHPRWIPAERLKQLDPRAGADKGRIYRVTKLGQRPAALPKLDALKGPDLLKLLQSPNATVRDMAHRELLFRRDATMMAPLIQIVTTNRVPAARLESLSMLSALIVPAPSSLIPWLKDEHPAIRRFVLQLAEKQINESKELSDAVLQMAADPDATVRFQTALTLGELKSPATIPALAELAQRDGQDAWFRSAILSSAGQDPADLFEHLLSLPKPTDGVRALLGPLTGLILSRDAKQGGQVLARLLPPPDKPAEAWQKQGLADWLTELDRRGLTLEKWLNEDATLRARWETVANAARNQALVSADSVAFLARDTTRLKEDYTLLLRTLVQPLDAATETAVLNRLRLLKQPDTAERLIALWPKFGPTRRELVISLLLGRNEWTAALLTAVEQGTVARQEISPSTQTRLLRLTNTQLQQRAEALFKSNRNSDRATVIARYSGVADLKGDVTHGATLFTQNCASCHALNGVGHAVGPDITIYRNKPVADFLVAILDPNAVIEPRFIAYHVEAKDDRSLTGLIAAENADSLTLLGGNGVRETVRRAEVISLKASSFSLMPEGLEQALTPQGMADLIAYLKSGD